MKDIVAGDNMIFISKKLTDVLGIKESFILSQIHYWICKNEENNINYMDGKYWTFNSMKKWNEEFFSFCSERTLKRIFKSLESKGILLVGNFNKLGFDRTKWYSIDYDRLNEIIDNNLEQNIINDKKENIVDNRKNIVKDNKQNSVNQTGQNIVNNTEPSLRQNIMMNSDNMSHFKVTDWHNERRQIVPNNTNNNKNKTTYYKQQLDRVSIIKIKGMLKEFLGSSYSNNYADRVIEILKSKGEECDYLNEKIEVTRRGNANNRCAFLMAALKSDYKTFVSRVGKNNKFINFEQSIYRYSGEEIDEIIRRKNRF